MFVDHDLTMSSAVDIDINYLSEDVVNLLLQSVISVAKPLHQCQFVKMNGTLYYRNMYVALDVVDDTPIFGKINAIYVQNLQAVLLLQKYTSEYVSHFSAYIVHDTDELAVCSIDQLLDYPLTVYLVGQQKMVVLKNFLYNRTQFDY